MTERHPRSEWMFMEHPEGTLYRATQLVDTAFARVYAAAGWTRLRRFLERLLVRLSRP